MCQIVNLASAAANNTVPERNNAVVKCKDNPIPSNSRADDANDTVSDTVPPAFVAVSANDSVKPSSVNNAVAGRANDITATAPPSLAKPFASANGDNAPPFDTVTVNNAVPDSAAANTGFCGDMGELKSTFIVSGCECRAVGDFWQVFAPALHEKRNASSPTINGDNPPGSYNRRKDNTPCPYTWSMPPRSRPSWSCSPISSANSNNINANSRDDNSGHIVPNICNAADACGAAKEVPRDR